MRIGLFGGTFDPPHLGHLVLAERCRDECGLDQVWFLPAYRPPHKAAGVSRFDHRCDMVGLAIVGQPAFRVEPVERELPPPSYTANTLAELRERHPGDELHLIVGADTLADLPNWYEPRRVLEQAGVIAVGRPGAPPPSELLLGDLAAVARLRVVACPLIDIPSREVRARAAAGRSIRYLVPRSVEEYIREKGLYAGG
jgi:nicotinate-nucleotide adenylyltransferase